MTTPNPPEWAVKTEVTRLQKENLELREELRSCVEKCAKAAEDFVEQSATHILHYHDKEGRTSEERVFHEARFGEIYKAILDSRPLVKKIMEEPK